MTKTQGTIFVSIFYILGIVSFFTGSVAWLSFGVLLLLVGLFFFRRVSYFFGLSLALVFIFGVFYANFREKPADALFFRAPSEVQITGTVASIPSTNTEGRTKFFFKASSLSGKKVGAKTLVTITDKSSGYKNIMIGDELSLKGKLRVPFAATNPSQFDYGAYLKHNGVFTTFYVEKGGYKILSPPTTNAWKFLNSLSKYRNKIIKIHSAYIKSPNLEVLGGMVFGDDAVNPPDYIKKSFINSGLLHILAASGLNVALIFAIWFFFASRLRLNYKLSLATGMLLVIIYTCMTGFGPSILRAALMLSFILIGKLLNRKSSSIALLFFVALVLLIFSPAMIFNVGFQLSFIVTFGLLLFMPLIMNETPRPKYINVIASAVFVPLVAQFFVAPIQAFYFNTFSTYSLFANIASLPFLTVISFGGFSASLIALLPFGAQACGAIDFLLNPFLSAIVFISDFFAGLPASLITVSKPSWAFLSAYYVLLLSFAALIASSFRNKKLWAVFSVLLCLLALSLVPQKNSNLELIFFDVQNADACLIKSPQSKYYLIDTGKMPFRNGSSQADMIVGKYLKDNGIKTLDILIVTHFDSDHSGGTVSILKNFKVKELVINGQNDNSKTSKEIFDYINKNKIHYKIAQNNAIAASEKDFSLKTFILPPEKKASDNEKSVVTLIEYKGFNALLMGDAPASTYRKIKENLPEKLTLLKIGHHGAKSTLSTEMLESTESVVISTGKNTYGHPHKSVLSLISASNKKLYRTDIHNAIKFSTDGTTHKTYLFSPQTSKFEEN